MALKFNPITGKFDVDTNTGAKGDTGVGVITGGTTNQVLAKNSNTNYDMKWVDMGGYTLPTASASVLGGVKVGTRLSIDGSGVLSADVQTTDISGKQDTLVSGTSIKTINSGSLLGSGNITLQAPLSEGTDYLNKTHLDAAYAPISVTNYTLPTAAAGTLGGVKVGTRLSITDGVLSADVQTTDISGKVDKVTGKGLSTNDYTTAEQSKLSGIEAGAEVNNISDVNATDLTDGGETTLHTHAGGSGSGIVESIVAGTNVSVDSTDPANPVVSSSGGGVPLYFPFTLADGSLIKLALIANAQLPFWLANGSSSPITLIT